MRSVNLRTAGIIIAFALMALEPKQAYCFIPTKSSSAAFSLSNDRPRIVSRRDGPSPPWPQCRVSIKTPLSSSPVDDNEGGPTMSFSNETYIVAANSDQYTISTQSSASSNAVIAKLSPPQNWLPLWKQRLITSEDPLSIHKLASLTFTLSGAGILATAAVRFAMGPTTFAEIPDFLAAPTYVFTASTIIMCLVSIRMSFIHRRYDLTARNAFLGTAASTLFSGFNFLWTSPLGPDVLNNQLVTQACFAVLLFTNIFLILDTCVRVEDAVEGRQDRKEDKEYPGRFFVEAMAYVFPIAWALPFILITGWVDAVLYNREWFFEQCQYIDQQTGVPGMQANLCYLQVMTAFSAAFGSLFVTLRDKKLISKTQEMAGITIFSVPALIWTIWVTQEFISYMTWD